ncbi:cell division protein FtsL [Minwuia sp.]|uniref:cell division protein FtsL n=1 Tax=Minwuia sp. TaxID=2493630 RepID=UPI003A946802
MNLSLTIMSALVGIAAIGAVYEIEGRHDAATDVARALDREIEATERDIHVLKAEWSYQTRPARLQELAESLLPLAPTSPDRIIANPAALQTVIERMDGIVEAKSAEAPK